MSYQNQGRRRSRSPIRKPVANSGEKQQQSGPRQEDMKKPQSDIKVKPERNDQATNGSTPKDNKTASNSTPKHSNPKTYVNPVTGKTERKFSNRSRLFVGNLGEMTEDDFRKLFSEFGEHSEVYVNKDKGFGFVKMDTRMNAEAAKNALDGSTHKGRTLTVRFASISAAVHVSNLGPLVSNEMLEKAFSTFGDVERAVVVVDDRGRSKGYGVVEFARKGSAITAIQKTNDGFFMIGKSPRPVFTKQQEQTDEEEGLIEKSIERQQGYRSERDAGARFATMGTFEYDWCQKWKSLDEMQRNKKEALESQFFELSEKLESDMAQALIDYDNEIHRRELIAKQEELRRQEEIMRQELLRQQSIEMRRHEEVRMQEEMRRQEEMRYQVEMLRRQDEEVMRRRQEEAAMVLGGRMPHGPPYGPPMQHGMMPGGPPGNHPHGLPPRGPLPPMARGRPNEMRHPNMAYNMDGERGRDRGMERNDRQRPGGRYDHQQRDRYGDRKKR